MTARGLHALIIRQLARTNMSESRFGRLATNDTALVSGLRAGRQPGVDVQRRILAALGEIANA